MYFKVPVNISAEFYGTPLSATIRNKLQGEQSLVSSRFRTGLIPSLRRGVPTAAIKGVAITSLLLVSALQAWSTKAGTRAQIATTAFKVIAIVAVFVAGLVYLGLGRIASSFSFEGSTHNATGYALALFSALWVSLLSALFRFLPHPRSPPTLISDTQFLLQAYDGFDQANYVARDCQPGALPKMINISLATIVILFLLANVAYFIVLPFEVATATSTIALDYGRQIAGPIGALFFALIVGISCLGALNSSLYTSSRLVVAAGEQGFLPRVSFPLN